MERRTFLKGAVIAASTPAVALAPIAAFGLATLIAQHADLTRLHLETEEKADLISDIPTRPWLAHVSAKEAGGFYHTVYPNMRAWYCEDELADLYDRDVIYIRDFQQFLSGNERKRRLAKIEASRARTIALYRERNAAYSEWAEASGYRVLNDEVYRLADLIDEVQDKILSYRCDSLDEVRAKAAFFDRVLGKEADRGFFDVFVKSLVA